MDTLVNFQRAEPRFSGQFSTRGNTHNLTLSQQRAEAVVKALVARGISAARLSAKGLASYAPVASNHSDAGKAQNRRVELVEQ